MTPQVWHNQDIVLYHGTLDIHTASILAGVNTANARPYTDFGKGFYTTTSERHARSWAWQLSGRKSGSFPAVLRFDVSRDALSSLETISFVRGDHDAEDFWSLIFHCRRGGTAHGRNVGPGWYDVVVGPVAASWRQRLAIKDLDQVSFHSSRAALVLDNSNPRVIP